MANYMWAARVIVALAGSMGKCTTGHIVTGDDGLDTMIRLGLTYHLM